MATAVPTTELAAVNEMLTAIGVTPVNTLAVSGLTDAAIALDTLRNVSKEVQSRGWWFNTDYNTSFAASSSEIAIPATILSARPARGTVDGVAPETAQFVIRDNKLWDIKNRTATFASSVTADVVREIEFENLPESARRYITVRSARIFQTKVLGDETQGVFTERHEEEAWQIIEGDEATMNPQPSLFMRRARMVASSFRPDPVTTPQGNQRSR